MIKLKTNDSNDEEEELDSSDEVRDVQEGDIKDLYGNFESESTLPPFGSGEEPGQIQRGFRDLAGLGSHFVWNRVLPGPWS